MDALIVAILGVAIFVAGPFAVVFIAIGVGDLLARFAKRH